jgi:hypothetical protein
MALTTADNVAGRKRIVIGSAGPKCDIGTRKCFPPLGALFSVLQATAQNKTPWAGARLSRGATWPERAMRWRLIVYRQLTSGALRWQSRFYEVEGFDACNACGTIAVFAYLAIEDSTPRYRILQNWQDTCEVKPEFCVEMGPSLTPKCLEKPHWGGSCRPIWHVTSAVHLPSEFCTLPM